MKKNNHLIVNMLDRELYNMMGTLQKKKNQSIPSWPDPQGGPASRGLIFLFLFVIFFIFVAGLLFKILDHSI